MNSGTNTKVRGLKKKRTKIPDPSPSIENKSRLNPVIQFVEPTKDPDADEEAVSINMCINDTVSKDKKMNYKTNSSKVVENFIITAQT